MPLTVEQMQTAAERVTFRPGWNLAIYQGRYEGPHLRAWCENVPDAYNPDQVTYLDVHSPIPPCRTEADFYDWLLWRLMRVDSHETREFFQVDGKPYADPHGPDADRDL
jgi:hypothetical protein